MEALFQALPIISDNSTDTVDLVGETRPATLSTHPDYTVTNRNERIGFIEVKAPGERADSRKFSGDHDRSSSRTQRPNLFYIDENEFSVRKNGEFSRKIVKLDSNMELSGKSLRTPKRDGNAGYAFPAERYKR